MTEWLAILAMGGGAVLFAIGGTGWKPARRFLLPILLGFIVSISGFLWWQAIIYAFGLCIALHLGYGERTPYWLKALVFFGYSVPSLVLGLTIWQIITPAVLFILFVLSNRRLTAKEVPWKTWEAFAGFLIGLTLSVLILKRS